MKIISGIKLAGSLVAALFRPGDKAAKAIRIVGAAIGLSAWAINRYVKDEDLERVGYAAGVWITTHGRGIAPDTYEGAETAAQTKVERCLVAMKRGVDSDDGRKS